MSSFIGIDLGTTFSAVATLDKTGRPVIIDNPDEAKNSLLKTTFKNLENELIKIIK